MFQNYQNLGQFKLSGATKNLLAGGAIGPGNLYQQTGIPIDQAKGYRQFVTRNQGQAYQQANPGIFAANSLANVRWLGNFGGSIGQAFNQGYNQQTQQGQQFQPNPQNRWSL
jgi:hypothetical protein